MITNDIYGAIMLMCVGMITVFAVLLIVIGLGNVLIKLVNKFAPEEAAVKKSPAVQAVQQVDATVKAVIDATIAQITGGKGHASKITKL
ncbi:MAG: OadG family protein [Bacteroidaceae bacterium]|nr:OadG family protein [Bacteroidaceae bacterium]